MEVSEISIIGGLLLILVLFAFVGFVKGLLKTLMALLTLAGSGFAAWWGYNYAPSWLAQRFDHVPEYLNIICASLGGALAFFLLYKICYFIANPFEPEEGTERGSGGWNFGLPAAFISVVLAGVFVYFCVNRMRETDQLEELKEMMTHGVEKADKRSGIHRWVMDELGESSIGEFLFKYDPLWDENKAKLVRLVVLYFQEGPGALPDNEAASAVLQDGDFQDWVIQQEEVLRAMKEQDASALWGSQVLEEALAKKELVKKLEKVEL